MSELGRLIDLELPEPRLKAGFKEYSSTSVPWITGFDGHVLFEEWTNFDEKILDMNNSVRSKLHARNTKKAARFIGAARDSMLRDPINEDDCEGDLRPVFSDSTSMLAVHCNVFNAVEDIVQHLSGTRTLGLKTKSLWLGKPDQEPKGFRKVTDEDKDDKKARTPDYTLMRLANLEDTVGTPICAFEIKGPCLDILGTPLRSEKSLASGHTRHSALKKEKISAGVLSNRFNFVFNATFKETKPSKDPVTPGIPTGRNNGIIIPFDRDELAVGGVNKARNMNDEENESDWPVPEEGIPSNSAYRPLAQALTYALSVTSGCAFLYNYQVGFGLEVKKTRDPNTLHVRVSRPFYLDDIPGPFDAMVALAVHGLSRERTDNGLPLFIRNMANMIRDSSKTDNTPFGAALQGGRKEGDTSNQDSRGIKRSSTYVQNREKQSPRYATKSAIRSKKHSKHCSRREVVTGMRPVLTLRNEMPRAISLLSTRDLNRQEKKRIVSESMSHCTIETECMSLSEARQLNYFGVIGSGKSGTVSKAVWNDLKVAVKQWNGWSQEGLDDLVRELSTLRSMNAQCPDIFGSVAPRVILNYIPSDEGKRAGGEPILVTEFVGERIFRDDYGKLFVCDATNPVNDRDEKAICVDALRGLNSLHANGFIHGDIELRNMRVERRESSEGKVAWRVWWIDFGLASAVAANPRHPSFRRERRTCKNLFSEI